MPYVLVLAPKRVASTSSSGSPTKKSKGKDLDQELAGRWYLRLPIASQKTKDQTDKQFDAELDSPDLRTSLAQSRKVELEYSLVVSGRATTPPHGDFSELQRLFPSTYAVEIFPPYLVFRVHTAPSKPWPLTIGGLPVCFLTDKHTDPFARGRMGRGQKLLTNLDLHRAADFNWSIVGQAVEIFKDRTIEIRDIFWFGDFWQITVQDNTDMKLLPSFIAAAPVFYRSVSEAPYADPAALRNKPPQGVDYDDTVYTTAPNALLRPGIMLSSSSRTTTTNEKKEKTFKTTSSGILVADQNGQLFITVASHGFEDDGLIFHPNPHAGNVIGNIVDTLLGTDISIAKLKPGLRYVNETFGTPDEVVGAKLNGLSPTFPPHLRIYDSLTMNNPFTGHSEGIVMAIGAMVEGDTGKYVKHEWSVYENGDGPVDGSCGSPILDQRGQVAGLFRFRIANSSMCLSVSAVTLREYGYEICGGEQTF